MNTRGPNGGKGASNQTTGNGRSPVRSTGYTAAGGKNKGDTAKVSSHQTSSPRVPKQASVNKGVTTQFNAGSQRLSRTKPPQSPAFSKSQTKVAGGKNGGRPREMQNSMTGKGTASG